MPAEELKPSPVTERAELAARIGRYERLLGYFVDPGALKAIRESIAELEARLKQLE